MRLAGYAVGNGSTLASARETLLPMMRHPIPRGAAGPMGWWYIFGSASMTLLMIQILTGIGLALVYVPAADKAYDSLLYLELRAAAGLVPAGAALLCRLGHGGAWCWPHMTQVFLHGAYKYPRELTWVSAWSCCSARWACSSPARCCAGIRTPTGAWRSAGRWPAACPVIGPEVVRLLLGGPIIGGDTLSRFFALHVFVIPGVLLAAAGAFTCGWCSSAESATRRSPGKAVDPGNLRRRYTSKS